MTPHIHPASNLLFGVVDFPLLPLRRRVVPRCQPKRILLLFEDRYHDLRWISMTCQAKRTHTDLSVHQHPSSFGIGVVKQVSGGLFPALTDEHRSTALILSDRPLRM